MSSEHTYDRIAAHFYESNKEAIPLETVIELLGLINLDVPKEALKAAMSMRGLDYRNGEITRKRPDEGQRPPKSDYSAFVLAAREAIDMASKPMPAGELIGISGLSTEAIPRELPHHLRSAGIYFIPGAGYWKHPQYATDTGELHYSPSRSEALVALMNAFQEHGWPLSGEEIEKATGGKVTSRFCSLSAHRNRHRLIRSVGNGMFVPYGAQATPSRPIPVSNNVMHTVIDHDPAEPIFRAENVRLYKIAPILAKHGVAKIKEGASVRNGRRQRYILMELTEAGYKAFKGMDARGKKEDF